MAHSSHLRSVHKACHRSRDRQRKGCACILSFPERRPRMPRESNPYPTSSSWHCRTLIDTLAYHRGVELGHIFRKQRQVQLNDHSHVDAAHTNIDVEPTPF